MISIGITPSPSPQPRHGHPTSRGLTFEARLLGLSWISASFPGFRFFQIRNPRRTGFLRKQSPDCETKEVSCLNRKVGIVVGLVLLGTFVGGVFAATPATQLLNVFVTNFPENESRVVLSDDFTLAANTTFTSEAITFDVSQFRHGRLMLEILVPIATIDIPITGLQLRVTPAFPLSPPGSYALGSPQYTTSGGAGTCEAGLCNVNTMTDSITLDAPLLWIHFSLHAREDVVFNVRIVAFLQR